MRRRASLLRRAYRASRNLWHHLRYDTEGGSYDPTRLWNDRHRANPTGLGAVGGGRDDESRYVQQRRESLDFLSTSGVSLEGASCVEVGSGSGFWSDVVTSEGALAYIGFDISATSVARCRRENPSRAFDELDFGVIHPDVARLHASLSFSIDVTQHVLGRDRILAFLGNMEAATRPSGHIVITSYTGHGDHEHADQGSALAKVFKPLVFVTWWDVPTLQDGLAKSALVRSAPFCDKTILLFKKSA